MVAFKNGDIVNVVHSHFIGGNEVKVSYHFKNNYKALAYLTSLLAFCNVRNAVSFDSQGTLQCMWSVCNFEYWVCSLNISQFCSR